MEQTVQELRTRQDNIENIVEPQIENPPEGDNPEQNIMDVITPRRENPILELTKDLKKITPPNFDGKQLGEGAENWLNEMEKYFELRHFGETTKALWGSYQLVGEAASWWTNVKEQNKYTKEDITWKQFVEHFRKRWLPQFFSMRR